MAVSVVALDVVNDKFTGASGTSIKKAINVINVINVVLDPWPNTQILVHHPIHL